MKKILFAVATLAFIASPASAATIAINGGSSWGGWQFLGDSTTDGLWAAGATNRPYDVYRTEFTLDVSQTVTGTRLDNNFTVGDGSSYTGNQAADIFAGDWQVGDIIAGFGAQYDAGFSTRRIFVGFDFDTNNFRSASSVGSIDGIRDGETAGDVSVTPSSNSRWLVNANTYSVFSSPLASSNPFTTALAHPVRVYAIASTSNLNAISYQFLYNISAANRAGNAGGAFSSATSVRILELFETGVDSVNSAQVMDGVTIPEPASWAMMIAGFGLTGAAMRRRRVTSAVA